MEVSSTCLPVCNVSYQFLRVGHIPDSYIHSFVGATSPSPSLSIHQDPHHRRHLLDRRHRFDFLVSQGEGLSMHAVSGYTYSQRQRTGGAISTSDSSSGFLCSGLRFPGFRLVGYVWEIHIQRTASTSTWFTRWSVPLQVVWVNNPGTDNESGGFDE